MCGIVGGVAQREISGILLEGLKRLEYRGYDSAGMAVLNQSTQTVSRHRELGKVCELDAAITQAPLSGSIGIAHTRWATHGKPSQNNAHPHMSGNKLTLVHNGIIENYEELREQLQAKGYQFLSETDSEVVVHLIDEILKTSTSLFDAVKTAIKSLEGAYGLGVMHSDFPNEIVTTRKGSPLVIGVGIGENFIASDQLALLQVTDRFIFLEEGDIARITLDDIRIEAENGEPVERETVQFEHGIDAADKGEYRHYMLKEIFEQPKVIADTLTGKISDTRLLEQAFGTEAEKIFDTVKAVQIVACGTSFHSGLVAKYWIESLVGIPCQVEVASEFRYRKVAVIEDSLFITISQSGETADTLAALRLAKQQGYKSSLVICNVPGSSLVRESDLVFMTNAGPEIGVASTKAFTTQLSALLLLTLALGRRFGLSEEKEQQIVQGLHSLPTLIENALALDDKIKEVSEDFAEKHHALFLGRGSLYPIALEGALKLKEISYIHAEAYPAGELKHGPLALVDSDMPIITVAPNNELLDKLKSNLEEVKARGGKLYVFADSKVKMEEDESCKVIAMPEVDEILEPIFYILPLQLLSYHVAVLKGTDVDQPRNLAKSVTVE